LAKIYTDLGKNTFHIQTKKFFKKQL